MKIAIYAAVAVLALAAAFFIGTLFPHSRSPSQQAPATVASADNPMKKLQMDQLCAQSASAYSSEHQMPGMADESTFEHAYSGRLGKCFVLMSFFINGHGGPNASSMTTQSLYDATSGTDYGDFRKRDALNNGKFQETIPMCQEFPDGSTLHACVNELEWRNYVDTLMHG